MYVPPHARENRPDVLAAAIGEIAFGALVTVSERAPHRPIVTHLPMLLIEDGARGTLAGHVSRANEQWQDYSNASAIATFVGPQFYVSPNAYATKEATHEVVPTWDYIVVEAAGTIAFFDEPERLRSLVDRLTDAHEASQPQPWSTNDAPPRFVAAQLRGIVGFELTIAELTGAWKLSRNRSAADRAGVAELASRSADPAVAHLAERLRLGT